MSAFLSFLSDCWSEVFFISENYPLGFGFWSCFYGLLWSLSSWFGCWTIFSNKYKNKE